MMLRFISQVFPGPEIVTAAACGEIAEMNKILRTNVSPNLTNEVGGTALSVASRFNHIEAVSLLLRLPNVDVNVQDNEGETALMKAAHHGHVKVVKALLGHKNIRLDLQDDEGWTALFHAKSLAVIKDLLKKDKKKLALNLVDNKNETALMFHTDQGRTSVVKEFLKYPTVDLDTENTEGMTALGLALDRERIALTKLLTKEIEKREKKRGRAPFAEIQNKITSVDENKSQEVTPQKEKLVIVEVQTPRSSKENLGEVGRPRSPRKPANKKFKISVRVALAEVQDELRPKRPQAKKKKIKKKKS